MAKGKRRSEAIQNPSSDPFSARYPNIAARVQDGWIEIGHDDFSHSFAKALDSGWECEVSYCKLCEALRSPRCRSGRGDTPPLQDQIYRRNVPGCGERNRNCRSSPTAWIFLQQKSHPDLTSRCGLPPWHNASRSLPQNRLSCRQELKSPTW
jgi:hypothetical protein